MEQQRSAPERLKALEVWLQTTNTTLTQVNGQRKYGGPPPGWSGPTPGAGCEIFLCQLPREVYEDTLIPLCQTAGPLYEFRLMMNFSGQNRGFAYAKYATPFAAREAIRTLHRSTLPCGTSLVVRLSTEKHQLVLEGLPDGLERPDMMKVLEELGEGLTGLTLKTAVVGPQRQRQTTALATYSSHHSASMVKKVVVQDPNGPISQQPIFQEVARQPQVSLKTVAFRKKFGVTLTVSWTSSTALPTSPDRQDKRGTPMPRRSSKAPNRPPRLSPPSLPLPPPQKPPLPRRPPGLSPNLPPSPPSFLPPPPPPPPLPLGRGGFSPAVGGGVGAPDFGGPARGPQEGGSAMEAALGGANPVLVLRWLCEAKGLGAPGYELLQQYPCAEGYQLFLWKISIPGLPTPALPVMVHVRPEPEGGVGGLMSQAQSAAAMEVLPHLLNTPQV